MTLEELGAALKAKREARGLTLDDVAGSLKIGTGHIAGLEAGDLSSMPHRAYARGFLRSYARYLGLSAEEYEPALKDVVPAQSDTITRAVYTPDAMAKPHMDTRWVGILLSLGVACLIGWGIWHFGLIDLVTRDGSKTPQTQAPLQSKDPNKAMEKIAAQTPKQPAVQAPVQAPVQTKTTGAQPGEGQQTSPSKAASANPNIAGMQSTAEINPNMPAGAGTNTALGSPENTASGAGVREPIQATVPAGSPWSTLQGNSTLAGKAGLADGAQQGGALAGLPGQNANPNIPGSVVSLMPEPGQHKLVVIANENCWMSAAQDGGRAQQKTLQKGDSVAFPFTTKLVLRLGNVGGVRVIYDGVEVPPQSGRGHARTMTFPPRQ